MKRKNQQEKVTSGTLSSSSSSLIGHDGSGNNFNPKSLTNTLKRCLPNDKDNFGIKLSMADSRKRIKKPSNKSRGQIESNLNKNEKSISSLIENAKSIGENKKRVKLKARRKCTPAESTMVNSKQKNNEGVDVSKTSNDTLQMKLLKEKILLRQKTGNATKKSKIIKDIEVKKGSSSTEVNNQCTKLNDKLSKPSNNNSQRITRKVKKELIEQAEEQEKFVKLHKLTSLSKQIDKKSSVIDKKSKISRYKENTISETDKVLPASQKKRSDLISNGSSLGLSISTSSVSSIASMKLTSKYVIPKTEISLNTNNNNYKNNNLNNNNNSRNEKDIRQDRNQTNMLSSASQILKEASPSIYKNAEERMKALRERLEAQIALDKLSSSNDELNTSNLNSFCEEMEWEPIEEEKIIFEVQAVRAQLGTEENDIQMLELPYGDSDTKLTTNINHTNNDAVIYVVIDTNVLLSSIETVEKIRDVSFKVHGKPIIIIPWTVIRELDFIKDDKLKTGSESLKCKARQAVRFLYHHFSIKHPQIKGQTFKDAVNNREKFAIECPDDEILQTCLQIRSPNSIVVLLSFDKNLCNKAMIHEIITLGKDDPPEKIIRLLQKDKRKGPRKKDDIIEKEIKTEECILPIPTSPVIFNEEPKLNFDDEFEETIDMLTAFLTVVVSCEMKNLFGDDWEKYTILKPPWTAIAVLKCAIKHWIAAVSESFIRKADSILKELLQLVIKSENNRNKQLKDVQYIIELFNDLIQCVSDANKYSNILRKSISAIKDLRNKCIIKSKHLAAVENKDAGIKDLTIEEQERRADLAFKYFEKIYEFTRDFCGAVSEVAGIPCSFQYDKSPLLSSLNSEDIKKTSPDVAGNLNGLLQALGITLENINEICINHRYITILYQLLTNFLPKITEEFTYDQLFPADIFYCLKHKEKHLKCGVTQLLELSNHFSHIAQLTS